MYSYGPPHMYGQKQDDQLEHTYSSYVRIRDVALKTCQRQWTIGRSGKRGSGLFVLAARHDDDDDLSINKVKYCLRIWQQESLFTVAPFFEEIDWDESFHVLHWPLCLELFFYRRVYVFPFHGLSFRLRLVVANLCLVHFETLFLLKQVSPYRSHFLRQMICTSQTAKICWQTFVEAWRIFSAIEMIFVINQFQTI